MNGTGFHRYSRDEVDRIIRQALRLKRDEMVSHDDLLDTAKELGLDSRTIETAIEEDSQEDVIATIHVLKNKTEVKKRVVTRQNKETDE